MTEYQCLIACVAVLSVFLFLDALLCFARINLLEKQVKRLENRFNELDERQSYRHYMEHLFSGK